MTHKNTRTTGLAKYEAQEKLRAEIQILEKIVSSTHLQNSHEQAEAWSKLAGLWTLLEPKASVSRRRESNRLNREDATLRSSWAGSSRLSDPDDEDETDDGRDTSGADAADARRGGGTVGTPSESPEDQGPRFNAPNFVFYYDDYNRYRERLFAKRKKGHPTLVEFERSKSAVDSEILRMYFLDRASYEEIFDEFGRVAENDPYGVYDISAKDAITVADAVEFAARKNGTFSCDEDDNCYTFFDMVNRRFRTVVARKINDKLFRVDFRIQNEDDKYYLPAKLDPSKKESIRPMQRYVDALVEEGRALMKQAKPTKAERKAASLRREAEREAVDARNRLGGGKDPDQWENGSISDESNKHTQETQLQIECRKVATLENQLKGRNKAKAIAGLNPYQLWKREQERGEEAFREFMALTGVDQAVARFAQPWRPPVEPEPAADVVRTQYQGPAVRHEVLRMSIQLSLNTVGHTSTGRGAGLEAA